MPLRVATWNLFHGRAVPAQHADQLPAFAEAIAAADWEVLALQETPPWWVRPLAEASGASARSARTSFARGVLPAAQRAVSAPDPERLGARGAAVNALLVRPSAGEIVAHRTATLRYLPQRRSVHAVELRRPSGRSIWVAGVHTHNRPEAAAAADLTRALRIARSWAGSDRLLFLGDLNLLDPSALAEAEGYAYLGGQRVDHILARGLRADGPIAASAVHPRPGVTLSDHRLVRLQVADAVAGDG